MPSIEVNGQVVEARDGEMLLETLRRAGIHIPTLCHVPELFPSGACRLCSVEVEGQPRLVPSCAFPAQEGLVVRTHSARAVDARRAIVELLLASHPDDCLYCSRNGTCGLQGLAEELCVSRRRLEPQPVQAHEDPSNPALVRDPAKCILCGRCVRICEEVQGISAIDFVGRGAATRVAPAFDDGLNVSPCIHCGQCVVACPTGALREASHLEAVAEALADPTLTCVVQHAPAISVTVAESLGLRPGADAQGLLTASLRRLGFSRVFDTSFAADLTIMEEANELVGRIRGGGTLPMMTSCSPGWVRFMEARHPDLLPHLSTCKSPQQMLGAVVKRIWAPGAGRAPARVFHVSVMPCTAKKAEAGRQGMAADGVPDVDAVLTTRELLRLLRMRGIDLSELAPEAPDMPFGERSTAGKLFGASGGVMEAALRTAHHLLTGEDPASLTVPDIRGLEGRKETHLEVGGHTVGVAVVSGLDQAEALLQEIAAGRSDLHFIEVMTCPGGCIAGGGQPHGADHKAIQARVRALYGIDRQGDGRTSHGNHAVKRLYAEHLGAPLGPESHALLHTSYQPGGGER